MDTPQAPSAAVDLTEVAGGYPTTLDRSWVMVEITIYWDRVLRFVGHASLRMDPGAEFCPHVYGPAGPVLDEMTMHMKVIESDIPGWVILRMHACDFGENPVLWPPRPARLCIADVGREISDVLHWPVHPTIAKQIGEVLGDAAVPRMMTTTIRRIG